MVLGLGESSAGVFRRTGAAVSISHARPRPRPCAGGPVDGVWDAERIPYGHSPAGAIPSPPGLLPQEYASAELRMAEETSGESI